MKRTISPYEWVSHCNVSRCNMPLPRVACPNASIKYDYNVLVHILHTQSYLLHLASRGLSHVRCSDRRVRSDVMKVCAARSATRPPCMHTFMHAASPFQQGSEMDDQYFSNWNCLQLPRLVCRLPRSYACRLFVRIPLGSTVGRPCLWPSAAKSKRCLWL